MLTRSARRAGTRLRCGVPLVLAGLRRFIDARPELLDSDFERDRRITRARAERTIARAPDDVRALAGQDDDQIDFASAALSASGDTHPKTVEQFERFVLLLERELSEVPTLEAKIDDLRRRLHGPTRRMSLVGINGLASALSEVLHLHCGNCAGNTVLWVAVAERLGLPVRPMYRPGHVVIAWGDGAGRRILETTERARETPIASYREFDDMAVWPGASDEQLLRPMTEVELLATILSNEVLELTDGNWKDPPKKYRQALETARRALILDADQPLARVAFSVAAARVGGPPMYEAVALLNETAARTDLAPLERLAVARGYSNCGVRLRTVELITPIEDEFPDDPRVIELRELLDRER